MLEIFLLVLQSIAVLILTIILLIISLPLFLYRWIISKLVPLFNSKISSIVPAQNQVFLSENLANVNVLITYKIEGTCNLENLKTIILDRMVHARNEKNGNLLYPELQQFPTKRLGYYFWSWDYNFNIDNHVLLYQNKSNHPISRKEVDDFESKYLESRLDKNKSPWEFLVVNNLEPDEEEEINKPYFLLIQKFHHSLSDGVSILAATLRLDNPVEAAATENSSSKTPTKILKVKKNSSFSNNSSWWGWIFFPFRASFNLVKQLRLQNISLPWRLSRIQSQKRNNTSNTTSNKITIKTHPIDVTKVKAIAHAHNVQFSSVVLAGLVGGLRKYLLTTERCLEQEFPKYLMCGVPVVINNTNRGDRLGNDMCTVTLPLPIATSDSYQRLCICNRIIVERTTSTQPYYTNLLMSWIGLLPSLNCTFRAKSLAAAWSCFPGPMEPAMRAGHVVQGMNFRVVSADDVYIAMTSLSYASKLQTILICNLTLCTNQDEASILISCIEEEYFNMAEKLTMADTVKEV